ncbi:MAG: hypothetical protein OSA95_02820 [Opitutales bacterium]|nr:hypothetical protein [Opitutales bacterium]
MTLKTTATRWHSDPMGYRTSPAYMHQLYLHDVHHVEGNRLYGKSNPFNTR